jgi:hypothetical protein
MVERYPSPPHGSSFLVSMMELHNASVLAGRGLASARLERWYRGREPMVDKDERVMDLSSSH